MSVIGVARLPHTSIAGNAKGLSHADKLSPNNRNIYLSGVVTKGQERPERDDGSSLSKTAIGLNPPVSRGSFLVIECPQQTTTNLMKA
jgi:hypothetical protein